MENKRKHLEFIQAIVARMANNSFLLRGWTITLVAAILALAAGENFRPQLAFVAYFPILVFWLLDGYFLWQERLFRAHYDTVRKISENHIDFGMDIRPYQGGRNTWRAAMLSNTVLIFYVALLVLTTIPAILLFDGV